MYTQCVFFQATLISMKVAADTGRNVYGDLTEYIFLSVFGLLYISAETQNDFLTHSLSSVFFPVSSVSEQPTVSPVAALSFTISPGPGVVGGEQSQATVPQKIHLC